MTQRICFQLQVKLDRLDEYARRHAEVWPEMRQALSEAGWTNYSLFLTPVGALIGYLECEDFTAAQAAMAATEVNSRWQHEMAELIDAVDDELPDEGIRPIPEVFHLA